MNGNTAFEKWVDGFQIRRGKKFTSDEYLAAINGFTAGVIAATQADNTFTLTQQNVEDAAEIIKDCALGILEQLAAQRGVELKVKDGEG